MTPRDIQKRLRALNDASLAKIRPLVARHSDDIDRLQAEVGHLIAEKDRAEVIRVVKAEGKRYMDLALASPEITAVKYDNEELMLMPLQDIEAMSPVLEALVGNLLKVHRGRQN